MEKQKRWQLLLIVAVILLTLINILPTIFYYSKPLHASIDKSRADSIAVEMIERVNGLEEDAEEWIVSFSKNLGIHPVQIVLKDNHPGLFEISFQTAHEAELFKRFLPRAGALIPFVPAQLELYPDAEIDDKTVLVARKVHVHLNPLDADRYFQYYPRTKDGQISTEFRQTVYDRVSQLALRLGGQSRAGQQIIAIAENPENDELNDLAVSLSKEIVDIHRTFGSKSPLTTRYLSSLLQVEAPEKEMLLQRFLARVEANKSRLENKKNALQNEEKEAKETLDSPTKQQVSLLESRINALTKARKIIEANRDLILAAKDPLTLEDIRKRLQKSESTVDPKDPIQTLSLEDRNPFIKSLGIDWGNNLIVLHVYSTVQQIRQLEKGTEEQDYLREKTNQYLIKAIAAVSRETDEAISPYGLDFSLPLTELTNAESFLAFDLGFLAEKRSEKILEYLDAEWQPEHPELRRESYPIISYRTYKTLSPQEKKLAIVVFAPAMFENEPPEGFRNTSIYVIAKGLDTIVQKYRHTPDAPGAEALSDDIQHLSQLLGKMGFISGRGATYGVPKEFSQDYIFELDDYYTMLLSATRENFTVKGDKKNAVLDFTDVEQRIITQNRIDESIQEDLLKWKDEYNTAQVALDPARHYEVPPPTKNVYWENFKLSLEKYFRGDDRKILRWGLDLSGGKTVRIGLRDQNNRVVTDQEDLSTAVNELYTRINKMGVAERTIRIENNNIILDFPGSQAFSASELVKASAMYFHIVNEKFSMQNADLQEYVAEFLQSVWNEAVVTNRKDVESINEIAWEHLGGNENGEFLQPRSEAAKILIDNGLRLAKPNENTSSAAFDDTLSRIGVMRGDDFSEWEGQTHPLLILFHNYALEGSSLTNVQVGYDPSQGNILTFSVKSTYERSKKGSGNPREDFYTWTSQFAENAIAGTPKEAYSQGRGWRMAVVLNNRIITMPALHASLRDSAMISGRFSQREITQLAADLKAGSLSFTPRILSEQNVSAELGKDERTRGIFAAIIGLILVAVAMIGYYRFAGLVATCAVLFNLLIIWGVLQNLGAALTLPGIAGIVLTIGMAVDANVLVFERIREEFKISSRIASAIQAGYRKAFSAIVDSNITTIIAALILIQFDSGPIKGFAITLIIGLVSSMFTALFLTRYFFAGWVKNPKHKSLSMAELVKNTKFDFLKYAKPAIITSLCIILLGGYLFYNQRHTLFGMDFTGGYSMSVELEEKTDLDQNYRNQAVAAFLAKGAGPNDFEIRELNKPNRLRIQFSLSMEEPGHPFYDLPETPSQDELKYEYERDPRIVWVVEALEQGGLNIQESDLMNLDMQWSMMSGQFSEKMRDNAVIALGFALLSILIYITFRFEFKYAVSAVIALSHDVIVTMGILAMLHKIGLPVQIDLEVVGAIMTIIGYSLNDTIIVFDRIREDTTVLRKLKFREMINHALNVTLSRTLMTSGTTLLVLFSLVLLGGQAIFDFSLVMTIGVIVGTFSSLFVASPVMLYFHDREVKQRGVALKGT